MAVAKRQRMPSWNRDCSFLFVQEQDEEERRDVFAVMNFSLHQILPEEEEISLEIIPNDVQSF